MPSKFEQIKEYCLQHQTEQRANILNGIIKTFNVTETTAVTYYHDWKKEFMKSKNVIPKPENEAVPEKKEERVREKFVFVEKQKPAQVKGEFPKENTKEEIKEFVAAAMEPQKEQKYLVMGSEGVKILSESELIKEPQEDAVNHPSHYTSGSIEVIDYILDKLTPEEFQGYCMGNVMKYISRWRHKGGFEDLKKASWYLNRLIETE